MDKRDIKLVSIESYCIGAGKSYLLNKIKNELPECCIIDEPVGTWEKLRNEEDESLLELFYKDKKKYSYMFQNCALLSRYENIENTIKNNPDKNIFITERCLETDKEVFAKMLNDDGYITKIEMDLYLKWFDMLTETSVKLSGIINVRTNVDLSLDRIKLRGRKGEDIISREYLDSLKFYQDKWFNSMDKNFPFLNIESGNVNEAIKFIKNL
jgi:deoxyadenosine/deoxycytidine kinase